MNLIKQLDDELKGIKLDDFEKVRYIYLRCCELFSFDSRWFFTDVLDDDKLHNKLLRKTFNLENISDDLVICHSFSRYILKPLIDELTSLNCKLVKGDTHSYVLISYYGQDWKLDATMGDLARVKLGLPTEGFSCGLRDYDLELDDIDLNLGFSDYTKEDYERRAVGNSFSDCIENVGYILKDSKAKYHYSDAVFLFDMLAQGYSEDDYTYFDKDYNFHKLIDVYGEDSFYDLSKVCGEYKINKIRYDDYKRLAKSLRYK